MTSIELPAKYHATNDSFDLVESYETERIEGGLTGGVITADAQLGEELVGVAVSVSRAGTSRNDMRLRADTAGGISAVSLARAVAVADEVTQRRRQARLNQVESEPTWDLDLDE